MMGTLVTRFSSQSCLPESGSITEDSGDSVCLPAQPPGTPHHLAETGHGHVEHPQAGRDEPAGAAGPEAAAAPGKGDRNMPGVVKLGLKDTIIL